MAQELSRRSVLKLVGAASSGALTIGVLAPRKAEAAFDPTTVSVSFHTPGDDRFVFSARFAGIATTSNPDDLEVKVSLTNNTTGEVITWVGPPTRVS